MNIKKTHIIGFVFVLISGSLMHFVYDWTGKNPIAAFVAPVNESPWEHLKLLFFPACIYMAAEYFIYGKRIKMFFAAKMTAIITGLLFILTFFYTYSGILGFNLLALDIFDFVIADALCFYIGYYIFENFEDGTYMDSAKGIAVLFLLALCFVVWTNNPPDLGVFWG